LPEETYGKIGQYLRNAAEGYVAEWQASQKGKGVSPSKRKNSNQKTK
jgi:hypothetical protein